MHVSIEGFGGKGARRGGRRREWVVKKSADWTEKHQTQARLDDHDLSHQLQGHWVHLSSMHNAWTKGRRKAIHTFRLRSP
jgi:hypothetical protein